MKKEKVVELLGENNLTWEQFLLGMEGKVFPCYEDGKCNWGEHDVKHWIKMNSFVINETSFKDLTELYNQFGDIEKHRELLNTPNYVECLESQTFIKGKKLIIEVEVVDSYMSSMIMAQMYGRSSDGTSGKILMGMKITSLHYSGANMFSMSNQEREILEMAGKILTSKLNQDEN